MPPLAVSTFMVFLIAVPVVVIWIVGLVDVIRGELSRQAKAAWIIIVLLLPVIGTAAYFLLRKPTSDEVRLRAAAVRDGPGRRDAGPRPPVD